MIPIVRVPKNGMVECPDCAAFYYPAEDGSCRIDADTIVCPNCAELRGYERCNDCGEYVESGDLTEGADCNNYCEVCWRDRFDYCYDCNGTFYNDDLYSYDDVCVCADCESDRRRADCPDSFKPTRGSIGSNDYSKMGSERCFGVELETHDCEGYGQLQGDPAWGAKNDCSVRGKEFYSAILSGDSGLDAIDRLCEFASDNDWEVDSRCGYHAHFDMRGESNDSLKAIALAYLSTYDVWSMFVSGDRLDNSFCGAASADVTDLWHCSDFSYFSDNQDRYEWINFCAYNKFSTFEVRLHEGTLDGRAVKNWVRGHAIFMDWASRNGWNIVRSKLFYSNTAEKMALLRKIWTEAGCADLADYYEARALVRC